MEFLSIDPHWILNIRSEFLTAIFQPISSMPNDYLYICIIALGYWMSPYNKLFTSLAFIAPFCAVLSFLLKNTFQILRPETTLHLIPITDPFGFPSSDVLVSSVFWGTVFLHISRYKYACFIPITLISITRVYAGVHSVHDVCSGIAIGLAIAYLFYKHPISYRTQRALSVAIIGLYMLISKNLFWPPTVFVSIGILLGSITTLPWIKTTKTPKKYKFDIWLVLYLILGIGALKSFSLIQSPYTDMITIIKYALLIPFIFILIPYLQKTTNKG